MKKSFSIKTILGNFVFINEENKSKEIQGKNVSSFTKFVLRGFCLGGFWLGGFLSGEFLLGVYVQGVLSCHQLKQFFGLKKN